MGYRVNYRGLEVVCDSFADLDALADHAHGGKDVAHDQRKVKKEGKSAPTGDPAKDFVMNLQEVHLKTMRVLIESDVPVTDTSLRAAMKVESNNQLGGYFGAITRAAKKANLANGRVVTKTMVNNKTGQRAFTYAIPKTVRDTLRHYL